MPLLRMIFKASFVAAGVGASLWICSHIFCVMWTTAHFAGSLYRGHVDLVVSLVNLRRFSLPPVLAELAPAFEQSWGWPRIWLGNESVSILVPLWFAEALLLGVCVGTAYLSRRHRPLLSQCIRCGYDLTGNVSGRCPECGVRREDRQGEAMK